MSARASWHDYNGGDYFITVCTKNREHYFGEIRNDEMILSEIGKYAVENLKQINGHYPNCEIPLFVVMPNHIHAIVVIDFVETMCTSSLQSTPSANERWKNILVDEKMQSISARRGKLSTAMGGFKRAITRFSNENDIDFGWQSRFHDHIIRNQDEMNRIATYIENNVLMWKEDKIYTE
nr:transposase [Microbacter margulisiae]